jgi:TonB family protein
MFSSFYFKYFALAISFLLHFILLFVVFFNNLSAVSHYTIKPQSISKFNFKISQPNFVTQNVKTTSIIKKTTSSIKKTSNPTQDTQQNNSSTIVAAQFQTEYLNNPPPHYPASAKRMGIEGELILLVVVQENGLPEEIKIHQSSGFAILDQSAIAAVEKWQFISAMQNGKNIKSSVLVPIKFQLT